jgi:hypothetical protein
LYFQFKKIKECGTVYDVYKQKKEKHNIGTDTYSFSNAENIGTRTLYAYMLEKKKGMVTMFGTLLHSR